MPTEPDRNTTSRVEGEDRRTVPAEEVEKRLFARGPRFAGEMKLPGFRKGRFRRELVIQRVGREAVMEEALREGLPGWYERAMIESGSLRSAIRSSTCPTRPRRASR